MINQRNRNLQIPAVVPNDIEGLTSCITNRADNVKIALRLLNEIKALSGRKVTRATRYVIQSKVTDTSLDGHDRMFVMNAAMEAFPEDAQELFEIQG